MSVSHASQAQSTPYERTFSQPQATLKKLITELQSSAAGRLPVLDGFIVPGDRPLNRYQRGYYQCVAQVSPAPSGRSMVRVSATITAWYVDPSAMKSGYQVLPSNGRLENDFLDRLQEALEGEAPSVSSKVSSNPKVSSPPPPTPRNKVGAPAPTISAPMPGDTAPGAKSKTSVAGLPFNLGDPLSAPLASSATKRAIVDKHAEEQQTEAKNLEEILKNQVHPTNLAAVKRSQTPVLGRPSEDAKVLFLAAAEDEFEILELNPNWVHVRISGLSRGWIRRSSLELPIAETDAQLSDPQPEEKSVRSDTAGSGKELFHVETEETASFPGEWEPLRGKTVRIVSLQKSNDNAADTGPGAKRAFAKSLFDKEYLDLAKAQTSVVGVVIIFDSSDGGMIAATLAALREWKTGTLSDEAFWRRCFLDPPEAFMPVTHP
ncbi:MAG: hypothetical protein ACRD23_19435 [Terriglobales bacterium]